MRAFMSAAAVLIAIAVGATFVLRADQQNTSRAFETQGVRLDASMITNNLGRMPPHTEMK